MWEKYFKMPFKNGFDVYIFDASGNPVANFIGEFTEGSRDKIVDCINGNYKSECKNIFELSKDKDYILMDEIPILLIRGWRHLTGVGGYGLSPEKAIEVQNSLAEYICERLNNK